MVYTIPPLPQGKTDRKEGETNGPDSKGQPTWKVATTFLRTNGTRDPWKVPKSLHSAANQLRTHTPHPILSSLSSKSPCLGGWGSPLVAAVPVCRTTWLELNFNKETLRLHSGSRFLSGLLEVWCIRHNTIWRRVSQITLGRALTQDAKGMRPLQCPSLNFIYTHL